MQVWRTSRSHPDPLTGPQHAGTATELIHITAALQFCRSEAIEVAGHQHIRREIKHLGILGKVLLRHTVDNSYIMPASAY